MNGKKSKIAIDVADGVFVFIALLSLAGLLYFGSLKEGYHMDEVYSYGLANSEYLPFMHMGYHDYTVKDWMKDYGPGESIVDFCRALKRDYGILKEQGFALKQTEIYQQYLRAQANSADTKSATWMTGSDYMDYLAAPAHNRFNYASVYYNQRGDVHPPLYYILLHTICSLFTGQFSKWFGLAVNIAALIGTMYLLYRMVRGYLGGSAAALATVACYGLGCGVISTAMLIRMYSLLTFFVTADCFLHVKMAQEGYQLKGRNRRWLVAVTLLGFLTHYYFVLYAAATALVVSVCMALRKQWKTLFGYCVTLAATAAAGLCVWPFAIRHVFHGYRGQEAFDSLRDGQARWIRVKVILGYAVEQVLGGRTWLLALPVLAAIGALAWALFRLCRKTAAGKRAERMLGRGQTLEKACIVVLPTVGYLVLTAQIVPFVVERYITCLYPYLCLFVIEGAYILARLAGKLPVFGGQADGRRTPFGQGKGSVLPGAAIAVCGAVVLLSSHFFHAMPSNLYIDGQDSFAVEKGTDCVFVLPDGSWNHSTQAIPIMARCEKVAVAYEEDLPEIGASYQHRNGGTVLVAVQLELETEPVLDEVKKCLGIENLTETARREDSEAVWIWLQ